MVTIFFIFYFYITYGYCLEVVPERPTIEYYNQKYIRDVKLQIRRVNRTSPHYIELKLTSLVGAGNNLTVHMQLLEELAGRYQPTPVVGAYKLCDLLYKEPYLGQMIAKQLPGNWSCPFPADTYHFKNLVVHLENFPFYIPFTWASSYSVNTRFDVRGYHTDTKEKIFGYNIHVKIVQKPRNKIG